MCRRMLALLAALGCVALAAAPSAHAQTPAEPIAINECVTLDIGTACTEARGAAVFQETPAGITVAVFTIRSVETFTGPTCTLRSERGPYVAASVLRDGEFKVTHVTEVSALQQSAGCFFGYIDCEDTFRFTYANGAIRHGDLDEVCRPEQ